MLAQLASTLSTTLHPVRVARTEEECVAIYRQRYAIYVAEKNETGASGADHARGEIRTPEDELRDATLFYIGTPSDVAGSLRVRSWQPGQIPADIRRRYSLDRFPDIDTRAVAQVAFMAVPATMRGTARVVGLTTGALEKVVSNHRVELMVAECPPGLLAAYGHFGLRPYGGRMISMSHGMQVPLAGVVGDLEHLRRRDSPWYPVLSRLAARGEFPKGDPTKLLAPFGRPGVETQPGQVLSIVQAALARNASSFLSKLPEASLTRLARTGLVFDVDSGVDVFAEGLVSRDVFVLLEGRIELRVNGARVNVMKPGDVLGEVAYFRGSGQRSGSLHSIEPCRLLHFRHGVLRRMAHEHPADGVAIYDALAQVLAERLAAWGGRSRPAEGSSEAVAEGAGA